MKIAKQINQEAGVGEIDLHAGINRLVMGKLIEHRKRPGMKYRTNELHQVTITPGMKFGKPCIDGHRMTVEQVAEMWWHGSTLEDLVTSWPFLGRGAILTCCWYMARYGGRTWKRRWKDWLVGADMELWKGHYDTCLLPPQREAGKK